MKRTICSILLCALLPAQSRDPTASGVTEAGRSLLRALEVALGGAGTDQERRVFFLIDPSPSLARTAFVESLGEVLRRMAPKLGRTRIGVKRMGSKARDFLPPTSEHGRVLDEVRRMVARPYRGFLNPFVDIRSLASLLSGKPGLREILLVSLENCDVEDDIEGTLAQLGRARVRFTALTREAYLADSYWAARPYERPPRGSKLTGGDSPFIDLPWGWLFQITTANEVSPSGFGVYGLNRLAGGSGGRVFLHSPQNIKHMCGVYSGCLFCSGDHVQDLEVYWDARVRRLAPPARSRREAFKEAANDPWLRAVLKAWRKASKAGLIRSSPSLKLSRTSASPDRNRGGRSLGLTFSLNFERNAAKADRARGECQKILSSFEEDLQRAEKTKGLPRQKAMANLTRLFLQLTKVNLITFSAWCREVAPGLLAGEDIRPPEIPWVDPGRRPAGIGYSNFSLCHGIRPFYEVDLPGGKTLRKELEVLDQMRARFMEEYGHTPFATALDRSGIARFTFTYPGTATPPRRIRPDSETAKDPKTATARPSRAGPSSGGNTGPTTGGGK